MSLNDASFWLVLSIAMLAALCFALEYRASAREKKRDERKASEEEWSAENRRRAAARQREAERGRWCTACTWFGRPDWPVTARCKHPINRSLVDGAPLEPPHALRNVIGKCGPEGKHWEKAS